MVWFGGLDLLGWAGQAGQRELGAIEAAAGPLAAAQAAAASRAVGHSPAGQSANFCSAADTGLGWREEALRGALLAVWQHRDAVT